MHNGHRMRRFPSEWTETEGEYLDCDIDFLHTSISDYAKEMQVRKHSGKFDIRDADSAYQKQCQVKYCDKRVVVAYYSHFQKWMCLAPPNPISHSYTTKNSSYWSIPSKLDEQLDKMLQKGGFLPGEDKGYSAIYALHSGIDEKPFYVGKTSDMRRRFLSHIKKISSRVSEKLIDEFLSGYEPYPVCIDVVRNAARGVRGTKKDPVLQVELRWIHEYLDQGYSLLNKHGTAKR